MENYIIRQEWNNADITANWNWNVWRQYKWNQKCELKIKSNTFSEQWWKHNMDFKKWCYKTILVNVLFQQLSVKHDKWYHIIPNIKDEKKYVLLTNIHDIRFLTCLEKKNDIIVISTHIE